MTIKPEYAQQEPSDGPRFGLLQSVLLLVVLMAVYLQTHAGASWLLVASGLAMALLAATVMVGGNRIARISIVVGLVLAVGALFRMPAPGGVFLEGIGRAQLFCSFFTAILMLREPAFRSGLLRRVGTFLVNQGERRRFVYLLSGSHVFGLMMHMGAVVLLGSMAAMPQENAGTRMEVAADRSQAAVAVILVLVICCGQACSGRWCRWLWPWSFIWSGRCGGGVALRTALTRLSVIRCPGQRCGDWWPSCCRSFCSSP